MDKTQTAKDLDKAISTGTVKNIVKCDKCGCYHRFDYDCSPRIEWNQLTPQNLYLLQYYGKTESIRSKARRELLRREA